MNTVKKRAALRFQVESLPASVDLKLSGGFDEHYHGFVINESFTGCCLALRSDIPLQKDQQVRIKVGHLGVLKAKVAWKSQIDKDVIKVGFDIQE